MRSGNKFLEHINRFRGFGKYTHLNLGSFVIIDFYDLNSNPERTMQSVKEQEAENYFAVHFKNEYQEATVLYYKENNFERLEKETLVFE